MSSWETLPGETPIDPSGLKRRGSVNSRRELAAAEALNVNEAFLKYLAAVRAADEGDYEPLTVMHQRYLETGA